MDPTELLPNPEVLRVIDVAVATDAITLATISTQLHAACPACGVVSLRVHSRYTRHLADLPWGDRPVRMTLHVRRFFCDEAACSHRVFAERLHGLAAAWARRTFRFQEGLRLLGLGLGGEAGSRVCQRLAMGASADTLLRLVLATPMPDEPPARVVGVDDWAWRKGKTYGTILVDLERHHILDLLPDRAASSLVCWLEKHPGIEIIARDRAGAYAEGARRGAPEAHQVADRWHLLTNVTATLKKVVDRRWSSLLPHLSGPAPVEVKEVEASSEGRENEEVSTASRARRMGQYLEVHRLRAEGLRMQDVARSLGVSYRTARLFLRSETFPERARRASILDAFLPYLYERWRAGCRDGKQLLGDIRARGYQGSKSIFYAWFAEEGRPIRRRRQALQASHSRHPKPLTPRQVTWRLACPKEELRETQRDDVRRWCEACPQLATVYALTQKLAAMLRGKEPPDLSAWLDAALQSDVSELKSLAAGIARDEQAVRLALTSDWSTSQVEGHNNRLKLLKRQMFGRAGLPLLRQRVLHPV